MGVMSRLVVKITANPESCITMLLEKLQKGDRSLADCCLCLQHILKDQPWENAETSYVTQNSHAYRTIMPSVNSTHIQRVHTPYQPESCSRPALVKPCDRPVQII